MPPTPPPIAPAEPPARWPVHRSFYVEYKNIDILNHLNHAAYFGFMETLRCDYYVPLIEGHDPSTLDIIVAEATCRYLAPVGYGEELLGEVAVARPLGRTSFVLLYRFSTPDGTVAARGRTVVVCYDYARSSKKEIPAERRTRMEAHTVDPASEGWSTEGR